MDFPVTPECSVEKLWVAIQGNQRVLQYVPDNWNKPTKCDRQYIVGLLGTLHNQYMRDWAAESRQSRAELKQQKKEKIEETDIVDSWLQIIAAAAPQASKYRPSLC